MASSIYQLKISFPDSRPLIWRRIQIEAQSSFIDLHESIQVIMNWTDEKGFFFLVGDAQVADPDDYEGSAADDIIDAYETELGDLIGKQQEALLYRYFDEESDWRLDISIEKQLEKQAQQHYPFCLAGAQQAPPEETENTQNYQKLLDQLLNGDYTAREKAQEVLGSDYDPNAFDLEEINDELLSFIELEFPLTNAPYGYFNNETDQIDLEQLLQPSALEIFQQQLENAKQQFQQYKELGEKALAQVPDKGLFWQFNEDSNSLAIIVQHLWGNMRSRWTDFLETDGEKGWRARDKEFEIEISSRKELFNKWEEGWLCLFTTLEELQAEHWCQKVLIRQEERQVWQAIHRQIAHYAYHIGQMVFLAKMLTDRPWQSLSIPKGKSEEFNTKKMG